MLDVDGHVVSAEALVKKVEGLVEAIDSGQKPAPSGQVAGPALDEPIHFMRMIHREMHPPELAPGGGFGARVGTLAKRVVRRLTSWYVEPRWQLQQDLDAQSIEFASQAYNNVWRIDAELNELRRQIARLKLQVVAANERASRTRHELAVLRESAERQEELLKGVAMEDEVQPLSKEISALLDRLGAVGTTGAEIDYVEFEDRFRGDHGDLAKSQERYVSLFPPTLAEGTIVDIGCGRGEMLALLEREGHQVLGVDLDSGMVDVCKEKGLPAVVDDGIHFLSQVPTGTLKGIFCAQVVEHLITPELEQLVRLAFRALRAGGPLVMETINPRSSFALGNHFYADTSHVRPVHPETLRFICEQVGFRTVELEERSPHPTMDLKEDLPEGPVGQAVQSLLENVFGYQDYVIVATK